MSTLIDPLRQVPTPTSVDASDGHAIPVRIYGAAGTGRPVVLLHGLESHSAWFARSANSIAETGCPVHAFDRCGSGVSGEVCVPGPRLSSLLDEIDAVAAFALRGREHKAVHIAGHCFGAILALLYASLHRPHRVSSVVLATPALYTHADVRVRDKLQILRTIVTRREAPIPVPLEPEQFSELDPFVEFVRYDPLALEVVPARFLVELVRARRLLPRAVRALRVPLLAMAAADDPICDNARTRRLLETATAPVEFREYQGARHILEFSARRDEFLDDLAAWYQRQEAA